MESRLGLPVVGRALEGRLLVRYRNTLVVLLALLLAIPMTLFLLKPAAVADLADSYPAGQQALLDSWAKGQTIALIRHVERCDHSRAPCLSAADGITDRARAVAVGVGAQFEHLGLARADLYNSPMTRAVQSAGYMFNQVSSGDTWLSSCRNHLLQDVLAHKVPGRNLVLVTHSECMAQLEKELNLPASTLGYGASLFISTDTLNGAPKMLGFIEASDWRRVALDQP